MFLPHVFGHSQKNGYVQNHCLTEKFYCLTEKFLPHVFGHSQKNGYVQKHCLTEKFLLLDRKILKGKNIAKKMAMSKIIA
jgi:hypothetical protein